MKATKRYSRNTTKKAIDTEKDPYLMKMGTKDMAICKTCLAIYCNKRWKIATAEELEGKNKYHKTSCPACQKIRDNFPGGYVTLKGEFLKGHKEEILNLIRNKEDRARRINPLERIMEIRDAKGMIEVTTTTDKFAQRLGRILNKALGGSVEYKWSSDVKTARVTWSR